MDRRSCLQTLAAAGLGAIGVPAFALDERLRIGLTPVILADQVAFLSRWAVYLSARVGCEVVFVARESYQAVLDLLFAGRIDVAWICGYPYVRHQADLSLLAVPMYQDRPVYQSYLIRSKTSPANIQGWADLRGKVLAYADPFSNSGWLVAQAQMAQAGVSPRELKRAFFAHGHRNVAEAVGAGLANAGAIDGYVWETMRLQGMPAVAQTEVVWKSESFGFPPLVSRQGVTHPFAASLQNALLTMPQDESGRDLLRSLNLTGFTLGEAALFESIRLQAQKVPGTGMAS
jgi:phosphonate transport system substrate-binding protein